MRVPGLEPMREPSCGVGRRSSGKAQCLPRLISLFCFLQGTEVPPPPSLRLQRTPPRFLSTATMSGPGNKRAAGDGGSGPPEKLSREEKTTTTLIEPIRLGGISSTVRGCCSSPSMGQTPVSASRTNGPEPYSLLRTKSRFTLQNTVLKEAKDNACCLFTDRNTGSQGS